MCSCFLCIIDQIGAFYLTGPVSTISDSSVNRREEFSFSPENENSVVIISRNENFCPPISWHFTAPMPPKGSGAALRGSLMPVSGPPRLGKPRKASGPCGRRRAAGIARSGSCSSRFRPHQRNRVPSAGGSHDGVMLLLVASTATGWTPKPSLLVASTATGGSGKPCPAARLWPASERNAPRSLAFEGSMFWYFEAAT